MYIDAHQHFWQFDPVRDSWINENMKAIQRDWLPGDLLPLLQENGIEGCITVQSDSSETENVFQLQQATANDWIKGIVGWVDLQAINIEERLAYYSAYPKMKGFRYVLQGETQRDLMLQPAFMNGIAALNKFNFTYDILIYPDQLKYIPTLVSSFPYQKFVIDHMAKPLIKDQQIQEWKKEMERVAGYDNLYCKISGIITEADWQHWQQQDIDPYLDAVVNAFGINRLMYGSDWPVCLVAGSYHRVLSSVKTYFSTFSKDEQALLFGQNAIEFYNI